MGKCLKLRSWLGVSTGNRATLNFDIFPTFPRVKVVFPELGVVSATTLTNILPTFLSFRVAVKDQKTKSGDLKNIFPIFLVVKVVAIAIRTETATLQLFIPIFLVVIVAVA